MEKITKHAVSYPNVLVTAFKGKTNSSSLLLHKIRAKNTDFLELTNSFITSEKELENKIEKGEFRYILAFGQKPNSAQITIETTAHKDEKQIKTTFQINRLRKFLGDNGIKSTVSENAGNYLCNNIYYFGQKYAKDNALNIKMVFIHLPPADSGYDFDKLAKTASKYIDFLAEVSG